MRREAERKTETDRKEYLRGETDRQTNMKMGVIRREANQRDIQREYWMKAYTLILLSWEKDSQDAANCHMKLRINY